MKKKEEEGLPSDWIFSQKRGAQARREDGQLVNRNAFQNRGTLFESVSFNIRRQRMRVYRKLKSNKLRIFQRAWEMIHISYNAISESKMRETLREVVA